jgi:DeoR family transcriptional regulator, carbon catabolite repression regulator
LEKSESMTVNDICDIFQVSRDTARRDIVKLTEQGAVVRTHGGIALPKFVQKFHHYVERQNNELEVKQRLAECAATYIQDNELIYLDVSTTVKCMIPHLHVKSLKVVTQSLDNAWLLMENERIQTYLLGGLISCETRHMMSYDALRKLADYRFTKVFLSAVGMNQEGIYYYHEDDVHLKRELTKRAEQVILILDHTKFDKCSFFKVLDFESIDMMITDRAPSPELQDKIENAGVQLIILPQPEDANV